MSETSTTAIALPRWFCRQCGHQTHHPQSFVELLRDTPGHLARCAWYEIPFALIFIPFLLPFEWWERSYPRCWWCDARMERGR